MSILGSEIAGARVLDLFAGSAALGLELLSRGATSVEFVELSREGVELVRRNIAALGAEGATVVRRADAIAHVRTLEPESFDIAVADPPYAAGLAEQLVEVWMERRFARILAVEHSTRDPVPQGGDTRSYGDTAITFYHMSND